MPGLGGLAARLVGQLGQGLAHRRLTGIEEGHAQGAEQTDDQQHHQHFQERKPATALHA